MKAEHIRRLYKVPPKLHESVVHTLQQLDETSVESYRKQRSARRFIVAFAVIASVVAFSSVAYATNLFGLLTESVGKHGIDMRIEKDGTTDSTITTKSTEQIVVCSVLVKYLSIVFYLRNYWWRFSCLWIAVFIFDMRI